MGLGALAGAVQGILRRFEPDLPQHILVLALLQPRLFLFQRGQLPLLEGLKRRFDSSTLGKGAISVAVRSSMPETTRRADSDLKALFMLCN